MHTTPPAPIRCPHCGRAATLVDRFFVRDTTGPVERLRFRCAAGHWLAPLATPGASRWILQSPARRLRGRRGA